MYVDVCFRFVVNSPDAESLKQYQKQNKTCDIFIVL